MAGETGSLTVVLVLCTLWLVARQHVQRQPELPASNATLQRVLKPRTPDYCPACRRQPRLPPSAPPPGPAVRPWREVQRRRGRPKRIATDGFACFSLTCPYYQITDAQIHALVGDGTHGKTERLQTLHCQACGATFTTRRHTALYRLKTTSQRIGLVLTALAEGLSVAAASRVLGHTEKGSGTTGVRESRRARHALPPTR